jgi:hypothetical protein
VAHTGTVVAPSFFACSGSFRKRKYPSPGFRPGAFGFDLRVPLENGAGTVQCGLMGAPGAERIDLVGGALNALFKAAWSDFDISPDVAALLADGQNGG